MKCELCNKVDAEQVVFLDVNGEQRELYVCKGCATNSEAQHESGNPESATARDTDTALSQLTAAGIPPLMGMILDAAFELFGHNLFTSDSKCKVCNIKRSEYRQLSRLGCSGCYESFAEELQDLIEEMHQADTHVGKLPQAMVQQMRVQNLRDQLEAAVAEQCFEEAIKLRDQLQIMEIQLESGEVSDDSKT